MQNTRETRNQIPLQLEANYMVMEIHPDIFNIYVDIHFDKVMFMENYIEFYCY